VTKAELAQSYQYQERRCCSCSDLVDRDGAASVVMGEGWHNRWPTRWVLLPKPDGESGGR
jgi:hypothetical protein